MALALGRTEFPCGALVCQGWAGLLFLWSTLIPHRWRASWFPDSCQVSPCQFWPVKGPSGRLEGSRKEEASFSALCRVFASSKCPLCLLESPEQAHSEDPSFCPVFLASGTEEPQPHPLYIKASYCSSSYCELPSCLTLANAINALPTSENPFTLSFQASLTSKGSSRWVSLLEGCTPSCMPSVPKNSHSLGCIVPVNDRLVQIPQLPRPLARIILRCVLCTIFQSVHVGVSSSCPLWYVA